MTGKRAGAIISIYTFVFLISFLFIKPNVNAEELTVNGYTLSMVNISQSDDNLEISGRLEYGQSCKKLRLSFLLQSDKGTHKSVSCIVKDAGTGSSLFEGNTRVKNNEKLSWTIEDVRTKCIGN